MTLEQFEYGSADLINDLEHFIEVMPRKGDTISTCQRMAIQQAINELSYAFNGVTEEDLSVGPNEANGFIGLD